MTKIIAFHLPQYHSFPENDKWWGKGFTDWDNVRKAKPLFPGHQQPKVPLDGYYNMLDKSTHIRQAQLAKKYGIYGFCYYHYWFNGKLLMEKPLEMILHEEEVDLPFCLCWANEPWTRSWNGKNGSVIMPQNYGGEDDWIAHIKYLMPFFRDERYIKVDNKPVMVIYRTSNIPNCDSIVMCWDKYCKEHGFSGIYLIEERNYFQQRSYCQHSSGILEFEPACTRLREKGTLIKVKNKIQEKLGKPYSTFSYRKTADRMVHRASRLEDNKKLYLGMFAGWDNTPRRKKGGEVAVGDTPEIFEEVLRKQCQKSRVMGAEFLFLNAWNEWAEGAYLEPDNFNGYKYLEAVKNVVCGEE